MLEPSLTKRMLIVVAAGNGVIGGIFFAFSASS